MIHITQSKSNSTNFFPRSRVYPSEFKSWEYAKETAQIFVSGASGITCKQDASEDQKFAAKSTLAETNF